jgi:hypothetical protein
MPGLVTSSEFLAVTAQLDLFKGHRLYESAVDALYRTYRTVGVAAAKQQADTFRELFEDHHLSNVARSTYEITV